MISLSQGLKSVKQLFLTENFQGGGLLGVFGVSVFRRVGFGDIDCIETDPFRGRIVESLGAKFVQGLL